MNRSKNIIVVCEGASEWMYLQRLNSFLSSQPFPEGWFDVPIRFIGKPPKTGVGTGEYKAVEREIRKVGRQNHLLDRFAWVDADLYVRNDKACGDNYLNRPKDIAPFAFSVLNFEDFLALHFDDDRFFCWREVMRTAGHFNRPLHWEEYRTLYQQVMPGYHKADIPADFITLESLGNLKRHLNQMPEVNFNGLKVDCSFAHIMLNALSCWYEFPE